MFEKKKVVIVGAGIAGLKCAQKLIESGKFESSDIVILEAKDRCGGRIYSVEGLSGEYDLGASWHHDTLTNPLFKEEANAEPPANFCFDDDYTTMIDSKSIIRSFDPHLKLEILKEECNKYIENEFYSSLEYPDKSYFEMINMYIFERKQFLTDDQIINLYKSIRTLELWHGIDWKSMSGKYAQVDNLGRNALCLPYGSVIKRITSKIPESMIKLNHPINSIERRGNKVYVNGKYECDYCVVSVPQSILNLSCMEDPTLKGRIEFKPPLNKDIQESFKKIHYGALGKVVFEFDSKWSNLNKKLYYMGAFPKESEDNETNITTCIRNNDSYTGDVVKTLDGLMSPACSNTNKVTSLNIEEFPLLIVNYMGITGKPALMILTQNPLTTFIEESHREKGASHINQMFGPVLSLLFKHLSPLQDTQPKIINTMVSDWTVDPYSRGSYTACFPGDDPLELSIVMERGQDSRIRFAGEHTVSDGTGATYGAWMSGEREADYIIERL